MAESPSPPPSQKSKRSGRIISATKRKLQAPIDAFVKRVRKSRNVSKDAAAPDRSSKEPQTTASSTHSAPTIPDGSPSPAPTGRRSVSRPIVIDEDDDDGSSNGDVLAADSDVIMLDAVAGEPSSSAATGKKAKGKDKESAGAGIRVTITGAYFSHLYLFNLLRQAQTK